MQKTYKNISAIIDKKLFNQLNWQAFQGTTLQVKELRTNILNKDGTQIQQQFLGKQGYILFTDTYYNGDMQKTYINVSATLDKKFFNQLKMAILSRHNLTTERSILQTFS